MSSARTCPGCGHTLTTGQIWRQLSRQIGWRIVCPACGKASEVPPRERFISALYLVVAPGLALIAASVISLPLSTRMAGVLIVFTYLVLAMIGSAFAARRLRLG
jgi:CXXC-20-CXXC protein